MNLNVLRDLFFLFFFLCALSAQAQQKITPEDLRSTRALVNEFQKLPLSVLECDRSAPSEINGERASSDRKSPPLETLSAIYQRFFSREFYRLFVWAQCSVPRNPPLRTGDDLIEQGVLNYTYHHDFRFGTAQVRGAEEGLENISVNTPRPLGNGKIGVKVTFEYGDLQLWNNYTLVFEDGSWKIDDMAPKSVATEAETLHWGSKGLKKELQLVYRYSEERYRREIGKKVP